MAFVETCVDASWPQFLKLGVLCRVLNRCCSCLSTVQLANGPKRSVGHVLGAEKGNFLIRVAERRSTMAAAPVESCQSLPKRSPWGRLGSQLDMGSRLHRMHGRFHRWMHISTGPQQCADLSHDPPKFSIQSSLASTENRRMRCRRLPDPRPIPDDVREPIYIRKK